MYTPRIPHASHIQNFVTSSSRRAIISLQTSQSGHIAYRTNAARDSKRLTCSLVMLMDNGATRTITRMGERVSDLACTNSCSWGKELSSSLERKRVCKFGNRISSESRRCMRYSAASAPGLDSFEYSIPNCWKFFARRLVVDMLREAFMRLSMSIYPPPSR